MTVERRGWHVRLMTLWLPLGVSLVFALFPFYWMAITSLKSNQELYSRKVMPLIVHNPTLKHYVDLITETNFLEWTWNTFVVAVISTAISLVLGAMLAYPLARRSSMEYLARVEAATGAIGTQPTWRQSLRHLFSFGDTMLDKLLA